MSHLGNGPMGGRSTGLNVVVLVIVTALFVLCVGLAVHLFTEPPAALCGYQRMEVGDTCVYHRDGEVTKETAAYQEIGSDLRSRHLVAWASIGGAALMLVLAVRRARSLVADRRRRGRYRGHYGRWPAQRVHRSHQR